MLRVTVDVVPSGDETRRRRVGVAVIGRLGAVESGRHRYAAAVWDDRRHRVPSVVVIDFDRDDGVWGLVRTVLTTVDDGAPPEELSEHTLYLLEQALRAPDGGGRSASG